MGVAGRSARSDLHVPDVMATCLDLLHPRGFPIKGGSFVPVRCNLVKLACLYRFDAAHPGSSRRPMSFRLGGRSRGRHGFRICLGRWEEAILGRFFDPCTVGERVASQGRPHPTCGSMGGVWNGPSIPIPSSVSWTGSFVYDPHVSMVRWDGPLG